MTTNETAVSKSNPAIKAILARTVLAGREWTGRKVTVVEVDASFSFTYYIDDQAHVWQLDGAQTTRVERPSYTSGTATKAQIVDGVIVVAYYGSSPSVRIYVPRFDAVAVEIAVDAVLEMGRGRAKRAGSARVDAVAELSTEPGILRAVAEARAKAVAS